MAQTLTRLLVHIVFSTKDRVPLIAPELEPKLFRYLGGICRNLESPLLACGGTADHVHLLVSQSKNIALAPLVMTVKKETSKWLKSQPEGNSRFKWQEGYGGFTIGESGVRTLERYLAGQKEHHRRRTFQDEFLALLAKYKVEYDPRYIWT
jgi:REP element-mobilizing transposase RayT